MKVSKGYKGKRYSEMVKDVMKKVNSKINSTLHKKLYILILNNDTSINKS